MQDWLTEKKLDRKALAALTANLSNVEAYQQFCDAEIASVMRAVLDEICGDAISLGAAEDADMAKLESSPDPTNLDGMSRKSSEEEGVPPPPDHAKQGEPMEVQTIQDAAQTMTQLPADARSEGVHSWEPLMNPAIELHSSHSE